jgi:hypothetical protein
METWAAAEQCAVLDYRQSPFAATARHKSPKPLKRLERVNGIEPSSSAWKAVALPLSYTRMCRQIRQTGSLLQQTGSRCKQRRNRRNPRP